MEPNYIRPVQTTASASRYDEFFAYFLVDWHWTYIFDKKRVDLDSANSNFFKQVFKFVNDSCLYTFWFSFILKFDKSQYYDNLHKYFYVKRVTSYVLW